MEYNIEDGKFYLGVDNTPPLQYHVEEFEDSEPYEGCYKLFGYRPRTIYNDITDTFYKYMWENATTNIEIICNDIPPQTYKWRLYEIKIINKWK